jgi:hypothetical protein
MKKIKINCKFLWIAAIVLTTNLAYSQWSLTTIPNPMWTNQNVGIGTSTPMKRLQIVSVETETVGLDGFPSLNSEPRQLRLSTRKLSNYNPTALNQSPMAPFNTIFDTDWDIDNNQGSLEFHYIDNLGPSFRSPFSLSPSGGTFNYDLSVAENFTVMGSTNLQATSATNLTASNITATNLNVSNITSSSLSIGAKKPTGAYANYTLSVDGTIVSKKEIVQVTSWADKVFHKNYKLMTLAEIEAFVTQYKHLPEIPSEVEVLENGMDVGEMHKLLLQKVEELTLHLIAQDKKISKLEAKLSGLSK